MTNLDSAYSVRGELPLDSDQTTDNFSSSARAEVYGMKDMLSFHQARLADGTSDNALLPPLTIADERNISEQSSGSDVLPEQKKETAGGFFDVLGAMLQGAGERLLDPVALVQNIACGAAFVAAGAFAIALLPEIVVVAGAVALTGLAAGAVVTALPEVFHDADVVANPGNHSMVEYRESHADLRHLGALGVDTIVQGFAGGLTIAARPMISHQMMAASMNHSSVAITSGARGTTLTTLGKPIKLKYDGDTLKDIELPDGTTAHRIGPGKYEEYYGINHPLLGDKKPYSASYEMLNNGDVVRETASQIQTFKPDGSIVTQIKKHVQATANVSEEASEIAEEAYKNLPEEFRNLVASTTKVKLGASVPDAIPALSGKTLRTDKGELPYEDKVAGVFVPATDEIGIRASDEMIDFVPRVLRHEVGHMVDKRLDFPSTKLAFESAFDQDFAKLPSEVRERLGYFLQRDKNGELGLKAHSETFAEIFSTLTSTYDKPLTQVLPSMVVFTLAKLLSVKPPHFTGGLIEHFPKTTAVVRESLSNAGYMTPY